MDLQTARITRELLVALTADPPDTEAMADLVMAMIAEHRTTPWLTIEASERIVNVIRTKRQTRREALARIVSALCKIFGWTDPADDPTPGLESPSTGP